MYFPLARVRSSIGDLKASRHLAAQTQSLDVVTAQDSSDIGDHWPSWAIQSLLLMMSDSSLAHEASRHLRFTTALLEIASAAVTLTPTLAFAKLEAIEACSSW